jgi:hypothetical protein
MTDAPTYSVDEARALLPEIRGTLLALAVERRRAGEAHAGLHRELRGAADRSPDVQEALEHRTADLRAGVKALLEHLESLGAVVRDLDAGLVDIPTIRDGEPAWLCWRLSDPELAWWHTTSEGFTSRRPL